MKIKVLVLYKIPSCGFNDMDKEKFDIVFPQENEFTEKEIRQHTKDTQVIVSVFASKITPEFMDQFPQLKLISNFGVGYDNIDITHASKRKIIVTNTPDPVTEPTAELTMGLMIAVSRKIGFLNNQIRTPQGLETGVMKNLSSTLYNKTLGIIGMGAIGKALARRAQVFGMQIIYHNRKPLVQEIESKYNAKWCSMDDLLKLADVISLHVPLTKDTHHMINSSAFDKMKNSVFIINTARGPVINQQDLIEALLQGKIAGAGLDVFENEPFIPDELKKLPNTVITPHVGTGTIETRQEMSRFISQLITKFADGQLNECIVNR